MHDHDRARLLERSASFLEMAAEKAEDGPEQYLGIVVSIATKFFSDAEAAGAFLEEAHARLPPSSLAARTWKAVQEQAGQILMRDSEIEARWDDDLGTIVFAPAE